MPEAPPQPKRPLWRRILRWTARLTLLMTLLTGGAGWWGYLERVHLVNRALAEVGPYQARLKTLDLDRQGNLDVRGLELLDRKTGNIVLSLPRITGRIGVDQLRQKRLTEVIIEAPEISVDERWLPSNAAATVPDASSSGGPPALAGFSIGNFEIREAKVSFHPNPDTTAEMTVSYRATDVAVGANGRIRSGEQSLALTDLLINSKEDGARPLKVEELRVNGRVKDGILELDTLALNQPELHASPTLISALRGAAQDARARRQARLAPSAQPVPKVPAASAAAPGGRGSHLLVGLRIGKLEIEDAGVSLKRFVPGNPVGPVLPDSEAHFTYRTSGIEWMFGQLPTMGSHELEVIYLNLEAPENQGHVRVRETLVEADPLVPNQALQIRRLEIKEPHVRWTPELRHLLSPKKTAASPAGTGTAAAENPPADRPSGWAGMVLEKAMLTKANIRLMDDAIAPYHMAFKGEVQLAGLRLDPQGWHSSQVQSLNLTEVKLTFPTRAGEPGKKPFFELPQGELAIIPDRWNRVKRVEFLMLNQPVVRLRDGNTPWIPAVDPGAMGPPFPVPEKPVVQAPAAEPPPVTPAPAPAATPTPWWQQLHFSSLTIQEGNLDIVAVAPKPVDFRGVLHVTTEPAEDGSVRQRLKLENVSASLPTLSRLPFPVAQAASLEAAVRLPHVWKERRVDELQLSGANVDAGEALMKLFEPDADPGPEPARKAAPRQEPKPEAGTTPWTVGKMGVSRSEVTISNLVPGLPSIKFGVEFQVADTPLAAEDLAENVAPQRLELANLRIPSPYEPLRSVAELDRVFLSFTLGGLMRKVIDKVEIESPTLYVGDDLFWYVDYYRKYVIESSQPAIDAPLFAANGEDDLVQAAAGAVVENEPPPSEAAWSVKRLQVHGGKLIVAPKGMPLKGLRDPFPFSIDTEVTRGTLEADLEIPQDTYEIPDLDLQLVGMKGHVTFNLPIKQQDNNLVETFEVDSIRWKGLRTGKAFLTVTYDTAGIYAKFGADAYEGYINGEVNIYLDDKFHWDGWIGGKNVQTHELTQVLCPGYFILDGKVEATLVAQGSKDELYQADGSFKNHSPGKFTIKALNGLINDLPKEWDHLQRKLTQMGLETLRDFEYDHAEAKCRFYGREGNGTLRFSGPHGSRNFDINVYDHRWTTDKPVATPHD